MRIVITGGAGFVGSHLCERLLKEGNYVICVDNFITGSHSNIEHLLNDINFEFIEHDTIKKLNIDGNVDAILHFASPASPVDYERLPLETLNVGTFGTYNMLTLAKEKNARFLLASTSEVYGDPAVHPQKESYWGNVNSIGPRSVYDEAKRVAEAYTMAFYRTHNVDTRIVRIFNTFGPRMRKNDGRVVPNFIEQALTGAPLTVYGDGTQTRSLCYIDDLVDGIIRLLHANYIYPVNCGNPHEMTVLEIAQLILELTNSKSSILMRPLPEDDPRQRCPDISVAIRELKWQPKVTSKVGLTRTIQGWPETNSHT